MRYYVLFAEPDMPKGFLDWKQYGVYNILDEALYALMESVEADIINGVEYVHMIKEVEI